MSNNNFDSFMQSTTSNSYSLKSVPDTYLDKQLATSKFPVFKIWHQPSSRFYAIKVFPYDNNGQIPKQFCNEIRFQNISPHPNILTGYSYVTDEILPIQGDNKRSAFILMDYASHGTLLNHVRENTNKFAYNEKLARTYFRQLMKGIEHLHSNGVAHLDIKSENVMIDGNFDLKIIDFDTAYSHGDNFISTTGTKYKRAPEMILKKCSNPYAADIFSAGIILFALKTGGKLAQQENEFVNDQNLYNCMQHDPKTFWKLHTNNMKETKGYFSDDFKKLFLHMVAEDPNKRATISDIKNSAWYNGPVYNENELVMEFASNFNFEDAYTENQTSQSWSSEENKFNKFENYFVGNSAIICED